MLTRRNWMQSAATVFTATALGVRTADATTMQEIPAHTMFIKNLHCEGCAKRLRNSVYKVEGVLAVKTHVKNGIAVITPTEGGNPSAKALWEAVENQKFQIAKLVTPNGTYEEKPQS